jgi:hypothetical protein
MVEDTEVRDTDPTGMYEMARRNHEMAVRSGLVKTRLERLDRPVDDDATVTFAELDEDSLAQTFKVLDEAFAGIEPVAAIEAPAKPKANGWVPTRPPGLEPPPPAIERRAQSITELDSPAPTSVALVFPSRTDPTERIRRLWPDQTSPVFTEVDADVTHPRTPTGRKAKRGPRFDFTDGLPFEEYMRNVRDDFRRVALEHRLLNVVFDERSRWS